MSVASTSRAIEAQSTASVVSDRVAEHTRDAQRVMLGSAADTASESADSKELLSFHIADEEYAVDILRVREIRGWGPVTRIPRMPEWVKGVLNLRGAIVPVIDLRLRFGLEPLAYGPTTVVVVLRVHSGELTRDVGVVVDAVSDVYAVAPKDIKPAPDFGSAANTGFLKGLITLEEGMVIVIDVDRVLDAADLDQLTNAAV